MEGAKFSNEKLNFFFPFKVERYWEDYAYHELRFPLSPYCIMSQPLIVASVGIEESPSYRLKGLATAAYYSGKFWELIRTERLRPPTTQNFVIIGLSATNLYQH